MLGRPGIWLPVQMYVTAGSWLIASVQTVLMTASSSTILAVHGNSSLTHTPALPRRANLYFDGAIGNRDWPLVIVVSRWPLMTEGGRSLSNRSASLGL